MKAIVQPHTWETPVLQLYQYVIPSSVLCSVQTLADAAAGFCELAADEEAATAGAAPAAAP